MDRQDVLKRLLYPKCKTAIEFQFDTLIANPLLSYITIQDIVQLNKIATSIKYSSKPKEKYKMIDNILAPRGFKKMASGTNRVTYRFLNDYRVVLKVAIDKVGLSDNGNEYRNQHLLKPFVTKCFEVSPCGTVGLFERVIPITSREEFIHISDHVFDLINNLIGKYVLEDIGEKFYMNYGLRDGFGPVLLDYPYVFELDGRKLICNVPEPLEPLGHCGGEIDYDIGYNNLICTKCGKRYLATELKSDIKSDKPKIIIKGEDSIMKCVLKRGNDVVAKLNSEDPVSTDTIKPRKQYDQLRGRLSRRENDNNHKNNKPYRPEIKTHDDVHLKARLKGYPKGKDANLDKNAREKEKKLEQNTPKIQVSFEEEKKETVTVNEQFSFEGGIKITSEEKPNNNVKENFLEKVDEIDRDILPENTNTQEEFATKLELVGSFIAIIRGYEIWNVETNELIGYINSDNEFEKDKETETVTEPDTFSEETETELAESVYQTEDVYNTVITEEVDVNYTDTEYSETTSSDTETNNEEPDISIGTVDENVEVIVDNTPIVEEVKPNRENKNESFGTTLGDIMPPELRNNTSYKTDRIVTPIENQFASSVNNDKSLEEQCEELVKEEQKENEAPELIIHKRNEDILNEYI